MGILPPPVGDRQKPRKWVYETDSEKLWQEGFVQIEFPDKQDCPRCNLFRVDKGTEHCSYCERELNGQIRKRGIKEMTE